MLVTELGLPAATASVFVPLSPPRIESGINMTMKEMYDSLYAMFSSGKTTPLPPTNGVVDNQAKTFGFTNIGGLTNADTEKTGLFSVL